MDRAAVRTLTQQLADDLAWLEEQCRTRSVSPSQANQTQADQAGALRLGAALVRNVVGPSLEGQQPKPLHLAVVGGAGTGKSTLANMLAGAILAESNPQAGFTRHPTGFLRTDAPTTWADHLGFLGPLRRLNEPAPSNLDENVYQLRRANPDLGVFSLLDQFVIWDCPDMTTWAASNYVPRLLEVAGLADVIVYVASDERYNDAVPTQFLRLLLEANKLVVVVLVKMREADAPAFVAHFQKEVLNSMPTPAVACMTVPHLNHDQIRDPIRLANQYRIPLINQIGVLVSNPQAIRNRNVQSAFAFLKGQQERLLSVARSDLDALASWRHLVQEGQIEFDNRYRREFLTNEKFRRFDEALVRLLELLELPGVGKVVSGVLSVLRTPYRLLKGFWGKMTNRPDTPSLPESKVLESALRGWLDQLRKEAARRADTHPLWAHVDRGFSAGLGEEAQKRFDSGIRSFQAGMVDEVERTARGIYEDLEKSPVALNTLRGAKFGMEIAAIAGTLVAGGLNVFDIVLVPLAASVTHQLVELLGKQYVDSQREQARTRQQALVAQHLTGPLASWLIDWPATGGSQYERLKLALDRIPPAIAKMAELAGQSRG